MFSDVRQIERYMAKISGPSLDRIDIHIEVWAVPFKELSTAPPGTGSNAIRQQVAITRVHQAERFNGHKARDNVQMPTREIRQFCH